MHKPDDFTVVTPQTWDLTHTPVIKCFPWNIKQACELIKLWQTGHSEYLGSNVKSNKALMKSQEKQLAVLQDTRSLDNNVTVYWLPDMHDLLELDEVRG